MPLLSLLLLTSPLWLSGQMLDGEAMPQQSPSVAPFSVMRHLSERGLHDPHDEFWNVYGQLTAISQYKLPFAAPYTDLNGSGMSLQPQAEVSFTGSLTLYAAVRLWRGGELYIVPEVISLRPLSHLAGLGSAIQNFELQKTGSQIPAPYLSRAFVRQTFNFDGPNVSRAPGQMLLGGSISSRRLVVTLGKLSIIDVFDKNTFAADLRNQYLNMSFMTHAAFDFAADARGYTWSAMLELYVDAWAFRFGHALVPMHPNQLALDFRLTQFYGQQIELEHSHTLFHRPGTIRVVAYRNRENTGRFDEATQAYQADPSRNATTCPNFSYQSNNAGAPDFCWVRRPDTKIGIGVAVEQFLTDDIGLFMRGMISDGHTEVYSYTSTDHSVSAGVLAHGSLWRRPADVFGVAHAHGFISKSHGVYLNAGGVDGFIGDGRLRQASEHVSEVFYSVNLWETLWLTADYQHIVNPGYNADRGPVNIFGARVHGEF